MFNLQPTNEFHTQKMCSVWCAKVDQIKREKEHTKKRHAHTSKPFEIQEKQAQRHYRLASKTKVEKFTHMYVLLWLPRKRKKKKKRIRNVPSDS